MLPKLRDASSMTQFETEIQKKDGWDNLQLLISY